MVLGDGWALLPPPEPDEPPDPLPPSFGHGWPLWPWRVPPEGAVDTPELGAVVAPGAALADGSGLAANTMATPPVTGGATLLLA